MENDDSMENYKLFLFNHYEYNAPLNVAYNKHCHIGYEVIFFIRGDADFVCEDHRFPCREFDILIVPPLGFHFTKHNVDHKNERFVMEFKHIDEVDRILKKLFATFAIINVKDNPIIIDWFYRFEKYKKTMSQEQFNLISKNMIVELVLNLYNFKKSLKDEDQKNAALPFLTTIIAHINNNFTTINNIDDICKDLFLSRTYVFYLLKKHLGISPMDYVKTKKITYAHKLISQGIKPTQANVMAGIPEYTTFYRLYKKHFGHAPSK